MITVQQWLYQVAELFNDIFWALMEVPIFAFLLGVLLFLIVAGLIAWLFYLGRKGKL